MSLSLKERAKLSIHKEGDANKQHASIINNEMFNNEEQEQESDNDEVIAIHHNHKR